MNQRQILLLALLILIGLLVLSGLRPYDRLTWWMEVAPILIAVPVLIASRRRFPLTSLAYILIFLHALILILGGHYTYARVPPGFWAQDLFHLARNHYDRLGHFAQGFVPAILARELLLRRTALTPGKWLSLLVVCVCLSISVFYEFIEWWSSLILGQSAEEFLGTQGDVWDSHWDMFMAFVGATTALILLSRLHDRQLKHFSCGAKPAQ